MIRASIHGERGKLGAVVDNRNGEESPALVVATRELKELCGCHNALTNDVNGVEMNQDASFGGTPDGIHNGGDSSLWTAVAEVGGGNWDFASATVANGGAASVQCSRKDGDTASFTRASSLAVSSYVAITGYVYLLSPPASSNLLISFQEDDVVVSDVVDILDYVNPGVSGVWQKFSIPFDDLNFTDTDFDEMGLLVVGTAGSPWAYLDDMQVENTGGSLIYSVGPGYDEWLRIVSFNISLAGPISQIGTTGLPSVDYTDFLNVSTLANGVVSRYVINGNTYDARQYTNLADILWYNNTTVVTQLYDATNLYMQIRVENPEPYVLRSEDGDRFEIVIQDDLSSLLWFRVGSTGIREIRSKLIK